LRTRWRTLTEVDVLKGFYDDFVRKQIPELKRRDFRYSLVQLNGLATVNTRYYHYARPENFGDLIDAEQSRKYGWILDKYYEYYDSVIGKIIGTMGDNELLI
jgi:predicted AlkP superfamily phosphohydrolase/phosphomutase